MYIYVLFLDLLPPNKIHSQNSSTRGFFSCVVLSSFPLLNVWKLLKKAPPHTRTFCISLPLPKTPHLALFFAHLSLILGQLSLPHTPGVYHLLIAHTLAHYNTNQNPSHPRSFAPPWHSAASFSVSIFSRNKHKWLSSSKLLSASLCLVHLASPALCLTVYVCESWWACGILTVPRRIALSLHRFAFEMTSSLSRLIQFRTASYGRVNIFFSATGVRLVGGGALLITMRWCCSQQPAWTNTLFSAPLTSINPCLDLCKHVF